MKFDQQINLIPIRHDDYAAVQNLARFYVYDISKHCGIAEDAFDWAFPENGLYECFDLSKYWTDTNCKSFLIRINGELGGFVIINKPDVSPGTDWNMSEFYIVAKFQGKGVGQHVAVQIFEQFKGSWEVLQLPSNKPAIAFWKKVVNTYTKGDYSESKESKTDPEPHDMIALRFRTSDI